MYRTLKTDYIGQYAQQYAAIICDQHFVQHAHVTGKQLVELCSVKQINLLAVKSIFELWQKETEKLYSPYFDYSAPDVKQAASAFMNTLSRNIKIARKDFEPILANAVEASLTWLFDPATFMAQQFTDAQTHYSVEKQFTPFMRYLFFHPELLRRLQQNVAAQAEDGKIARETLLSLTQELAYEQATEPFARVIDQYAQTLAISLEDCIAQPATLGATATEADILEAIANQGFDPALLVDDDDDELLHQTQHPELEHGPEDLYRTDSLMRKEDEKPRSKDMLGNFASAVRASFTAPEPPTQTPMFGQPTANEPEKLLFAPKQPAEEQKSESAANTTSGPSESTETLPMFKAEKQATSLLFNRSEPVADLKSIRELIPLFLRFKFQSELFNNDADALNAALDKIDSFTNAHEALMHIRHEYIQKYNWDLGAEATIEFLSIVDKKF